MAGISLASSASRPSWKVSLLGRRRGQGRARGAAEPVQECFTADSFISELGGASSFDFSGVTPAGESKGHAG